MENTNETFSDIGSTRIIWWLLGLFAAATMGGGSIWINSVSGQISELQHELKEMRGFVDTRFKEWQTESTNAIVTRSERMSQMEVKNVMLEMRVAELEKKLDRMVDNEPISFRPDGVQRKPPK